MPVEISHPTPEDLRIRYSSGYVWLLARIGILVIGAALLVYFRGPEWLPVYVGFAAVAVSFWVVTWTVVDVEVSRNRRELTERKMVLMGLAEIGPQVTLKLNEIEGIRQRLTITHRTDLYRVEVILRGGEFQLLSVPYWGAKTCSDHAAKIAEFADVPLAAPIEVTIKSGLFGSR